MKLASKVSSLENLRELRKTFWNSEKLRKTQETARFAIVLRFGVIRCHHFQFPKTDVSGRSEDRKIFPEAHKFRSTLELTRTLRVYFRRRRTREKPSLFKLPTLPPHHACSYAQALDLALIPTMNSTTQPPHPNSSRLLQSGRRRSLHPTNPS